MIVLITFMSISVSAAEADDDENRAGYIPYIDGYGDGTFRPEEPVTRGEAIIMTASLTEGADDIREEKTFSDVAQGSQYSEAVCALSKRGFLESCSGMLMPDAAMTRRELAALAYQLGHGASDLSVDDLFIKAVEDAIIRGDEDGSFRADDCVTRAEAVTLFNRVLTSKFGVQDTSMLSKGVFSDVAPEHWAYNDILLASRAAHKPTSLPAQLPSDYADKKFDKYNELGREWETIPMVTKEMRERGIFGGEGGQRICSIAVSNDGQFLMVGTDVAGFWASYDGGARWNNMYGGLYPRGGFAIEIDPVNDNRILVYGGYPPQTGSGNETNGLYLSEDRGRTWSFVLQQRGACMTLDFRESIAFDPTSYDEKEDKCMVAYWSRPWHMQNAPSVKAFNDENEIRIFEGDEKGLFKTEDGGNTWFVVNSDMTDGVVKVNPSDGTVYVSNFNGFHRSTDGGKTFTTVLGGSMIYGMDVTDAYPDRVYVNDYKGVLISDDAGASFKRINAKNFPASYDLTNPERIVRNLKVSPVNPDYMVVADFQGAYRYLSKKYYSHDGGVTWSQSAYDASDDFFKANTRDTCFVWHPTDENKLWAFGGDWVVSSNDAGATYKWDYNGGSAVCMTARSTFNIYNPDLFYYGSQDFHGALTKDGGKTWKHMWKAVGSQGAGFVYGAYAADENVMIALVSSEQAVDGVGGAGGWAGVREIRVSRDGGETWVKTGVYKLDNHTKSWSEICYQSPNNPNILFAANFRSDDYGYTWEKMENVNAVYCHNPYGKKELYGSFENHIMVSYDDGATWEQYADVLVPETLSDAPETTEIWDIAIDGINNIVYYISGTDGGGKYFAKVQNGETTDLTDRRVTSDHGKRFTLVTVDPRYPNVVYLAGTCWTYVEENSVQRSVDGGETFQVLTVSGKDSSIVKTGPPSGYIVRDIMVNPVNGELWCMNGVKGWSKIGPPYEN